MPRRRKLRNVRHRQWVRWLDYWYRLPTAKSRGRLAVPKAWAESHRWVR